MDLYFLYNAVRYESEKIEIVIYVLRTVMSIVSVLNKMKHYCRY